MAATGVKGIDVLQTGTAVINKVFFAVSGAPTGTGTATIEMIEIESDGTIKSYDFNDNTFKTTACTTYTANMTARSANNSTVTTGIWTHALTTLTGLTVGAVYVSIMRLSGADNPVQARIWQWGSVEGNGTTTIASAGVAYQIVAPDWSKVQNPTTSVNLSATQIYSSQTIGNVTALTILADTAASATSTTLVGSIAVGGDSRPVGCLLKIHSGTGVGQVRIISGYVNSTKTFTLSRAWDTTPDATSSYYVLPAQAAAIDSSLNHSGSVASVVGAVGSVTGAVGSVTGAVASVTGNVGGNVVGSVASVSGAVGSVTGNVGGNVVGNVNGNVVGSVASVTGNIGGISGVTIPATIASPTNITAGIITTVTNLTNAPTAGDFTATMKTSLNAATPSVTVSDKTGFALTAGERTSIGTAVWATTSRVLTAFGFTVDTNANSTETAIKAKTDNLPASPASEGNVTSVGSAVVSVGTNVSTILGKFSGITLLKNWLANIMGKTADSDTTAEIQATTAGATYNNTEDSLEAITDAGASITNYITIPEAVAQASQDEATISIVRGDTLRVSLPVMGTISSRTKLTFTAKESTDDADSAAIFQVIEGTGLTVLNGGSTVTAAHASLTVTNATTGAVDLVLNATETALLEVQDLVWDCQAILSTGITTPISGQVLVTADVTKATS